MGDLSVGNNVDKGELILRFSHNVLEHLGLKLYQNKPTNVLAELVSNSWDALAENVWIDLETDTNGAPISIAVSDDGSGMDDTALQQNYLVVGKPKSDARVLSSDTSENPKARPPMGRKGIGKLAPFGVARQVDLITAKDGTVTWLRFDYARMLDSENDHSSFSEYKPDIILRDVALSTLVPEDAIAGRAFVEKFKQRMLEKKSGTLVLAHDLTVRRPITVRALMESLGRRFTVTLARNDFVVSVNDTKLEEKYVFPEWLVRYPETGFITEQVETPQGLKEVRCWAGFVKEASWPQEEAGVGVYAHGKIAQDRPFLFGNKGNEIFSRYMYAVVEADWVDELAYDAISTDRTSINWDDPNFDKFYTWGNTLVKGWINDYQRFLKARSKEEGLELVNKVVARSNISIRSSEKEHLTDLLSEITPRLGRDQEGQERLVEATVRAWVHEPARKLIKKLWQEASMFDAEKFSLVVDNLVEQLVPESLSLAVVFSQRVYALTQLENHIMLGMETQLQQLLEQFPWIISNEFESFVPRRSLKKICEENLTDRNSVIRSVHLTSEADYTKPDFVFFGNADDKIILIVELKGPGDVASWPEYEQLHAYMSYVQSRNSSALVKGVLLARSFDEGIIRQKPPTVDFVEWQTLLLKSRKDHMILLAGLLAGTEADSQDARVQQICELGGDTVKDFLAQMSKNNPDFLLPLRT